MNRPWGHPLLIFLVCAGVLVTVYSLTLLPLAVTFLVVGLVAVAGASVWLYRSRAAAPAEISNLVGIGHPAELNEPEAVHDAQAAYGSEMADGAEVVEEADDLSEPRPVETPALLPEQWQMLRRWVEEAAQAHAQPPSQPDPDPDPATDDWALPEMADVWEPEPAPAETPALAAEAAPPQEPALTAPPEAAPTSTLEGAPAPAPAPAPPPPRRAAPIFAQATTYQDGEITKRSQIALRLSGRMHR